jgi:hypothetical protein
VTPGRALERLRMAVRLGRDGWAHEDDVARLRVPTHVLSGLVRDGLAERDHTRHARPGDQGYTVWYRPKEPA